MPPQSRVLVALLVTAMPDANADAPVRAGPDVLPLEGSARGLCNLGGGLEAETGDPQFERFQQIDLQWRDVEPKDGQYDWTAVTKALSSIRSSRRMAMLKIKSDYKPA
jgi:hypothetical protein